MRKKLQTIGVGLVALIAQPALVAFPAVPWQEAEQATEATMDVKDEGYRVTIQFDGKNGTPMLHFIQLGQAITGKSLEFNDLEVQDVRIRMLGKTTVAKDEFWTFFQGILKNNGFAMVRYGSDDDEGSFYSIQNAISSSGPRASNNSYIRTQAIFLTPGELEEIGPKNPALLVTTNITLNRVSAQEMQSVLSGYLTNPNIENIRFVSSSNELVITGYADDVLNMKNICDSVDVKASKQRSTSLHRIELEYAKSPEIARSVNELIYADMERSNPTSNGDSRGSSRPVPQQAPSVLADERTNSIVVLGTDAERDRIASFVDQLDIKVDTPEQVVPEKVGYHTQFIDLENFPAHEIQQTVQRWLHSGPTQPHVSVIAGPGGKSLVVVAPTLELMDTIKTMVTRLDQGPTGG